MFCLLHQRKHVRGDYSLPSCAILLQLALFPFFPWVTTSIRVGRAGSHPWGHPRCFLTGQALDAKCETGLHHQGPTLVPTRALSGMFPAAPIPSWLQDLITNSRCQFGDRHRDEKSQARVPATYTLCYWCYHCYYKSKRRQVLGTKRGVCKSQRGRPQ